MRDLAGIYRRADIYDAIYRGRGKDYRSDSARIVGYIRDRNRNACSLLDIACGTGAHLQYFMQGFDRVEGVDLSPEMLRLAKVKNPAINFHQDDMRTFVAERKFDAITCLFSSIGYLEGVPELNQAIGSFARNLAPGGVVVVEPWWFPDRATAQDIVADVVEVGDRTISRVSRAVRRGNAHHIEVHYTVAEARTGIEHFSDTHHLWIYTRQQYEDAFAAAGLSVRYVQHDGNGPGFFIGANDIMVDG